MKRPTFILFFVALCAVISLMGCQQRSTDGAAASQGEYESVGTATDAVQRMHDYHFSDTLTRGGHQYRYTIDRVASDSLPVVTDDEGRRFADNVYTLTIERDGQQLMQRRFTKQAFAAQLSPEFNRRGLLDGMMLDRSLPGLAFAVSVSLPQSDMLEPLLLHVDGAGGVSIERDLRAENDFE